MCKYAVDALKVRYYCMHAMNYTASVSTYTPDETAIVTFQRIISQHCWEQRATCWVRLATLLRQVVTIGCCWIKFYHFQNWANNPQQVATRRKRVAKRAQQFAPNNVVICCVEMLRSFNRGFIDHNTVLKAGKKALWKIKCLFGDQMPLLFEMYVGFSYLSIIREY